MKRRKLLRAIAAVLTTCMLAGCVLTGCGSKSDNANKETTQSGSTLIYGSNDSQESIRLLMSMERLICFCLMV